LMGEWGLSYCQEQWGVLDLHDLCGGKSPGASRIASLVAWVLPGCVVTSS
jgi:hypothetical protein